MDKTQDAKVRTEAARLNEAEAKRLREKDAPVTVAISRFKGKHKVEMVENGFNYDEKSNPGYISTFRGDSNPFDASESIFGLDYLFANDSLSVFGKILHNQSKRHDISAWKPTYTLGDLSKLDPKALASRAISATDDIAPPNRSDIASRDTLLSTSPAVQDGPNADFSQYLVHALKRIAETPQYQAFSPKLRENYLQHSAKLIVLQLYGILTHGHTISSFNSGKVQLGKSNISAVLEPVKTEYIGSFAEDKNRQHAIRVWKAQKKVVAAQQAAAKKEAEPVLAAKPKAAAGKPATKTPAAPAAGKAAKPETAKEAPKMVFALQFPETKPFQACAGSVLSEAGKLLLETSVLAPWQLTSITSFDRNLAKLKKARTTKVATIKLDGATGEGKTHLINLLKAAYAGSINVISIDLNSSEEAIKQIAKIKPSQDKVTVVIVDELYFYNDIFLATVGKTGATDSATIEKLKAEYIRDLQAKGILVCVSGATENPLIYKLAAERIRDKLANAYQDLAEEEDKIFKAKLQESGMSKRTDLTDEELDGIEMGESDESGRLKEYIEAQENKLARKTSTADRMDRKRRTIQTKISAADSTYAKSDRLDSYSLIDQSKLKQGKSTLYILPDIDAKGFSAANCKEVVGDQNCVVITPFFLNAGQPNQSLRYKIWTKTNDIFTAQEVQDEDIGKAFAALGSTLPRVIIYDKTTAVGGDLGGLALGVEDIVLQYKSAGKSWDDAVQNAGRDRTPKTKGANGNEILTAKFHVISDKESKKELVSSLEETQNTQDAERMTAYLGKGERKKKPKTVEYLEKARDQLEDFTEKLGTAKSDYELGAVARYRKKIEDEKRKEEEKRTAFESKKSELRRKLTEFEAVIANIEASDAGFPAIAAAATDLSQFFDSHNKFLGNIGTDVEKGVAALRSKADATKLDLDRVAESLADTNTANQARTASIQKAREDIQSLRAEIDAVQEDIDKLPNDSLFNDISSLISRNLEQSQNLTTTSSKKVKDAEGQKAISERKQTELLSKMDAATARKEEEILARERAAQEKAAKKALLKAQRQEITALAQSLEATKTERLLEIISLETSIKEAASDLVTEITAAKKELAHLKPGAKEALEEDSSTSTAIQDLQRKVAELKTSLENAIDEELTADKIAAENNVGILTTKKQRITESRVVLDDSSTQIQDLQAEIEGFRGAKQSELEALRQRVESQKLISAAESKAKLAATEQSQAALEGEAAARRKDEQEIEKLNRARADLSQLYTTEIAILESTGTQELIQRVNEKFVTVKQTIESLNAISQSNAILLTEAGIYQLTDLTKRITASIEEIAEVSDEYGEISSYNMDEELLRLKEDLEGRREKAQILDLNSAFTLSKAFQTVGTKFVQDIANKEAIIAALINPEAKKGLLKESIEEFSIAENGAAEIDESTDAINEYTVKKEGFALEIKQAKALEDAKREGQSRAEIKRAARSQEEVEAKKINAESSILASKIKDQNAESLEALEEIGIKADSAELRQKLLEVKQELRTLKQRISGSKATEEIEESDDSVELNITALKEKQLLLQGNLRDAETRLDTINTDSQTTVLANVALQRLKAEDAEANRIATSVEALAEEISDIEANISTSISEVLQKTEEARKQIAASGEEEAASKKAEAVRLAAFKKEAERLATAEKDLNAKLLADLVKRKKELTQNCDTISATLLNLQTAYDVMITQKDPLNEQKGDEEDGVEEEEAAILREIEALKKEREEITVESDATITTVREFASSDNPSEAAKISAAIQTAKEHSKSLVTLNEKIKALGKRIEDTTRKALEIQQEDVEELITAKTFKTDFTKRKRPASAPVTENRIAPLVRPKSAPHATGGATDPTTMKAEIALTQALIKAAAMTRPDTKPEDWAKEYRIGSEEENQVAANETMRAYLTKNNKAMGTLAADGVTIKMNEIAATIGSENATLKAYGNACIKIKNLQIKNPTLTVANILQQIWDPTDTKPGPNATPKDKDAFRKKSESFLSVPEKAALIAMHIATSDLDNATRDSYKNLGLKLSEKASDDSNTKKQAVAALTSLMTGSKLNDSLRWVANPENIFNTERVIYDAKTTVPQYSINKNVKFVVNGSNVELPCPTFKMREAAQALLASLPKTHQ